MKLHLPLLLVLITNFCSAQSFYEYPIPFLLDGVGHGSVAFSDIDNDNDQDVIIAGFVGTWVQTKLYINNGNGYFNEAKNSTFPGIRTGCIVFEDVNGDGYEDVLLSGDPIVGSKICDLYINDGMGNFTKKEGTPFEGVHLSAVEFSDIDNDGDQDVLVTGRSNSAEGSTRLYVNDGNGNFTEQVSNQFPQVRNGDIAFGDIDNDNDQDVIISGGFGSSSRVTRIFENDGDGNFVQVPDVHLLGLHLGTVSLNDLDNDGDLDLFSTGSNTNPAGPYAILYFNDGTGNFIEQTGTPFVGVDNSSTEFIDIDNDNDLDVLILGEDDSETRISQLYTNDGQGNFTEVSETALVGVGSGSMKFADINNDGNQDVLITGENNSNQTITHLYTNDGSANFSQINISSEQITGAHLGTLDFADVDSDGDQDLFVAGLNQGSRISKLYINDGTGIFVERTGTPFIGIFNGSASFSDIDGDEDEDILISGLTNGTTPETNLFINDGSGNYSQLTSTSLENLAYSSIAFADIDGDNDKDVFIAGRDAMGIKVSKLYTNNGLGDFTEKNDTPFEGIINGSVVFGDVDNDQDMDILLSGEVGFQNSITRLFINDGLGNYQELNGTPFIGLKNCSIQFADINGDSFQDIVTIGENENEIATTNIYVNDGSNNFSEDVETTIENVKNGSISFSDIDKDNDLDLFISGDNEQENMTSKLYVNDGNGNFTEILDTPFENVGFGSSSAFIDINRDSFDDLFLLGLINEDGNTSSIAKLYINEGIISFSPEIELTDKNDIYFYPNPVTNGNIVIKYKDYPYLVQLTILDSNGRICLIEKNMGLEEDGKYNFDISSLERGKYIINLSDGLQNNYSKILIIP